MTAPGNPAPQAGAFAHGGNGSISFVGTVVGVGTGGAAAFVVVGVAGAVVAATAAVVVAAAVAADVGYRPGAQ